MRTIVSDPFLMSFLELSFERSNLPVVCGFEQIIIISYARCPHSLPSWGLASLSPNASNEVTPPSIQGDPVYLGSPIMLATVTDLGIHVDLRSGRRGQRDSILRLRFGVSGNQSPCFPKLSDVMMWPGRFQESCQESWIWSQSHRIQLRHGSWWHR